MLHDLSVGNLKLYVLSFLKILLNSFYARSSFCLKTLKLENSAAFSLLALPCMLTQLAAIANSDTTHLFVALGDFRMRVPGPKSFTPTRPHRLRMESLLLRCSVCPVCHYQIEFRMQIVFGWKAL